MAGVGTRTGTRPVAEPAPGRSYEFAGAAHQLPLTEPAARNAIHGLVRWAAWSTAEREADRVVMEHTLHPQPGYPFSLALGIEYALSDEGLRVTTTRDERRARGLSIRMRAAPLPDARNRDGGHAGSPGARANRAHRRRPRAPDGLRARRGHRVRLPQPRGRSERRSSTTPSPISSETTTAAPASSFGDPDRETR